MEKDREKYCSQSEVMCFYINYVGMFHVKEFKYKLFLFFNIKKKKRNFSRFSSLLGYSTKFLVVEGICRNVTARNNKARDKNGRNNESAGLRESHCF